MITRTLNRVFLMGFIAKTPELKYTKNNKAFCNINLMTYTAWIDDEGEVQSKPMYHKLVAWGTLAEKHAMKLVKGSQCLIEGELRTTVRKTHNNTSYMINDVRIVDMYLIARTI